MKERVLIYEYEKKEVPSRQAYTKNTLLIQFIDRVPVIKALKMQHHLSPFGSHISILGPYSQADYEIRPGRGRLTKERPRRRVNIGNILKKPRRGSEGVWDDKLTA